MLCRLYGRHGEVLRIKGTSGPRGIRLQVAVRLVYEVSQGRLLDRPCFMQSRGEGMKDSIHIAAMTAKPTYQRYLKMLRLLDLSLASSVQ